MSGFVGFAPKSRRGGSPAQSSDEVRPAAIAAGPRACSLGSARTRPMARLGHAGAGSKTSVLSRSRDQSRRVAPRTEEDRTETARQETHIQTAQSTSPCTASGAGHWPEPVSEALRLAAKTAGQRWIRRSPMTDFWTTGPTAAALGLRVLGFSPREAERLVRLKLRYERGGFRELTITHKRLLFARWLVDHGRLSDWPTPETSPSNRGAHDNGPARGRTNGH